MQFGLMNNPMNPVPGEIEAIADLGFSFVDLTMEGPCGGDVDVPLVRDILARRNLFITGHTDPSLPWAFPLKSVRRACLAELTRCAKVFSALGATFMNLHVCYACPPAMRSQMVDLNREALSDIASMAADHNLILGVENFLAPFDTVAAFQTLLNVPNTCLHLDAGHANIGKSSTSDFCAAFSERIGHLHFSDNRGQTDAHMPIGAGNINWRATLAALKTAGYDRTVTLEVFCMDPDAWRAYTVQSRRLIENMMNEGKGKRKKDKR
ncbi:MAG: sugar phosphate isomerase/epimerase family protein [Thermodesulfobacteriota bacterium]